MNQVAVIDNQERQLTAANVRAHVNLVQEVMRGVMKSETHYGVIPGCQKPSLYKAGSEVLLTTFRISVEPEVDDLSTPDAIRYRVRAVGRHQMTGIVVGIGIGECSSDEDKYKWRKAASDKEFDNTPEDRRRIKYSSYWDKNKRQRVESETKQVRTEPADLANTVLKMAKKRAQIDLTLTATSASDIFTQDLEDVSEEMREAVAEDEPKREPVQQPQSRSGRPASTDRTTTDYECITEKQGKLIYAKLHAGKIEKERFLTAFSIEDVPALSKSKVNDALAWIEGESA